MEKAEAERQEAIKTLKGILKPGDVVFTNVRYVSSPGMSRGIGVHVFRGGRKNPQHYWLSRLVAKACGYRWNDGRDGGYALQQRWV